MGQSLGPTVIISWLLPVLPGSGWLSRGFVGHTIPRRREPRPRPRDGTLKAYGPRVRMARSLASTSVHGTALTAPLFNSEARRWTLDPDTEEAVEPAWLNERYSHSRDRALAFASPRCGGLQRAVLAWGERHFGPSETFCLIHPDNSASIRVALKCGYRELVRSTYKGQPTLIFVR